MKPLSAVTTPILAKLYADRARSIDAATAELRRMTEQNNRMIDKLTAGNPPARPNGKETS